MRFANVLETTLRQRVLQRMTRWLPQFGAVISANYMRRYMKFSATRKIGQFLRDYRLLARSGLFMHGAYNKHYFKNHYLKSEYFAFLSLPHYLLRGERRGWRPNPFFDPVFFERRAKTRRFADYLRDPALWTHSTSDYFDACWYAKARTIPPLVDENPLHHFWHVGFDKGFSPSPRFETTFFKAAIARDERHYEKRYTFEYLCDTDQKPPLNAAELEANQRSFRDSIDLRTLKFAPSAAKKFLVFIQAGNGFVPKFVTPDTPFDILINFYDGIGNTDGVQYAFAQRGTKTTAVKTLMDSFPELFDRYEATLFLDDDIEISVRDIGALFQARAEYQLDLLQASLSAESSCYYPFLKQPTVGAGLRYASGVEIMMPLISRRALRDCGWVFGESISGWGVDMLLSAEVRRRYGNSIGVLGDAVAVHKRPTRTNKNPLYKFLSAHGVSATAEAGRIALKYHLDDSGAWIGPCGSAPARRPVEHMDRAASSCENASHVC